MLKLPYDYIRGLVEGEGTFTFSTSSRKRPDGSIKKVRMPAFAIKMHERDEELIRALRNTLGLRNMVHNFAPGKNRPNCGRQAMLIVRDLGQLRNIIIPFFYKKLHGNKRKQFIDWLERMKEKDMSHEAQFLHMLYKKGYFERTLDKFQ